jgi:signal transduction histidine kinase
MCLRARRSWRRATRARLPRHHGGRRDRAGHVGLDLGRRQGAVVDANLVDPPLEPLVPDRVAADAQRVVARPERGARRAGRDLDPTHVEPQRPGAVGRRHERQRVVRDLHDGAQQRLVHTLITLKLLRSELQKREQDVPALLSEALDHAQRATDELRELVHGIRPAILTRGGLRAAVRELALRMPVPVENGVCARRFSATVETTAYFVIAEALTNVAKHAHAEHASITVHVDDRILRVQVRDNGVGGARPEGSGLVRLGDRLAALGGRFSVEGPAGGGTLVIAEIPIRD